MRARRFPLKRLTAVLLPVTFLWLCAACAFICGKETAVAAGRSLSGPSAELGEMQGAPQCEGCPLASFPKVTTPDSRAAFDAGSQSAAAGLPPSLQVHTPAVASLVRPRAQAPPAASPLQFLPALRI